jgi:hypothetical protein
MSTRRYEVVLTLDLDPDDGDPPERWDWRALLDLGADEDVIVQKVTEGEAGR